MMNTGSTRLPQPSVGSWVTYGLGSVNQNLPAFIALAPGGVPAQNLRSAFLPGAYQGTSINTSNTAIDKLIENIKNRYTSLPEQRKQLDLLHQLNEAAQPEPAQGRRSWRRGCRPTNWRTRCNWRPRTPLTSARNRRKCGRMYGDNTQAGRQMLIARRLLENGVRFVQVWHGGWDHHNNLEVGLSKKAEECDKPIAALLTDLKQRGMLKDTLVIWGGEFGRSPTADGNVAGGTPGRTHNNKAFSIWMAGGGVKGGDGLWRDG